MFQPRLAIRTAWVALGLLCGLATSLSAHAGPKSYQGTFAADNDFVVFDHLDITSAAGGTISAQTFSYGGGLNAAGNVISAGGFVPLLVLFGGDGKQVHTEVASSPSSCTGPTFCWDVGFSLPLAAGSYTLVLLQDGNTPVGDFKDGYTYSSDPYFTGHSYDGTDRSFIRWSDGAPLSGNWALDIAVVNAAAPVPEPTGAALLAFGLGALALLRRRQCH